VSGHIHVRVIEYLLAAHFHGGHLPADSGAQLPVGKFNQVGQGGGIGVPVAAAPVFQCGDLIILRLEGCSQNNEQYDDKVSHFFIPLKNARKMPCGIHYKKPFRVFT
jgi:hypothetical protein